MDGKTPQPEKRSARIRAVALAKAQAKAQDKVKPSSLVKTRAASPLNSSGRQLRPKTSPSETVTKNTGKPCSVALTNIISQPSLSITPCSILALKKRAKKTAATKPLTTAQQLNQIREGRVDLESPESVLTGVNLRSLINRENFNGLPPLHQYKLIRLLPQVDQVVGPHGSLRLSSTALSNEYFTRACLDWTQRLSRGEFTPESQQRIRQEMLKEKAKLDPWKVRHFEPVWGLKSEDDAAESLGLCSADYSSSTSGNKSKPLLKKSRFTSSSFRRSSPVTEGPPPAKKLKVEESEELILPDLDMAAATENVKKAEEMFVPDSVLGATDDLALEEAKLEAEDKVPSSSGLAAADEPNESPLQEEPCPDTVLSCSSQAGVQSDHQADVIKSDDQADAVQSDDQADAVRSDHQADVVRSDHQADLLKSDHQADVVKSDHQADAVRSDHQADLLKSDHQADVVRSDQADVVHSDQADVRSDLQADLQEHDEDQCEQEEVESFRQADVVPCDQSGNRHDEVMQHGEAGDIRTTQVVQSDQQVCLDQCGQSELVESEHPADIGEMSLAELVEGEQSAEVVEDRDVAAGEVGSVEMESVPVGKEDEVKAGVVDLMLETDGIMKQVMKESEEEGTSSQEVPDYLVDTEVSLGDLPPDASVTSAMTGSDIDFAEFPLSLDEESLPGMDEVVDQMINSSDSSGGDSCPATAKDNDLSSILMTAAAVNLGSTGDAGQSQSEVSTPHTDSDIMLAEAEEFIKRETSSMVGSSEPNQYLYVSNGPQEEFSTQQIASSNFQVVPDHCEASIANIPFQNDLLSSSAPINSSYYPVHDNTYLPFASQDNTPSPAYSLPQNSIVESALPSSRPVRLPSFGAVASAVSKTSVPLPKGFKLPSSTISTSSSNSSSKYRGRPQGTALSKRQVREPKGEVNLERSYQICKAVIANSPNREALQSQLVPPQSIVKKSHSVHQPTSSSEKKASGPPKKSLKKVSVGRPSSPQTRPARPTSAFPSFSYSGGPLVMRPRMVGRSFVPQMGKASSPIPFLLDNGKPPRRPFVEMQKSDKTVHMTPPCSGNGPPRVSSAPPVQADGNMITVRNVKLPPHLLSQVYRGTSSTPASPCSPTPGPTVSHIVVTRYQEHPPEPPPSCNRCNLKAMVTCSKCGLFVHDDCLGQPHYCVACIQGC